MNDYTLTINKPTLEGTREMIERLQQIGMETETASGGDLAELDEEAAVIWEALSDLVVSLLMDTDLIQPLVASKGS